MTGNTSPALDAQERYIERATFGGRPTDEPDEIMGEVVTDDLTLMPVQLEEAAAPGFAPHQGENRRMRLTGVAKFAPHPDMAPAEANGLRRRLLKQRQRQRLGKLDVETRRLQRKASKWV